MEQERQKASEKSKLDVSGREGGEEVLGVEDLKLRLGIKNNHIRELYDRLAEAELVAEESRVVRETAERRMEDLEEQRDRLGQRVQGFEDEERRRRRNREDQDRQAARAARELERRDAEISRLEQLLAAREQELESLEREAGDAGQRIEGLQRDLEEREAEAADLRATMDGLRGELEEEYERRRRLAEPANRLRAGLDLFNQSQQIRAVHSLSRDLGQPEVHVALEKGDEPPAILTLTWQGITWQTYAANPGIAVQEPRVYLVSAGEDLSGVDRKPPNARLGPGGRVVLGL